MGVACQVVPLKFFLLESSIHRIPNESLSFCISNLYISRKEIEIYTTVQRDRSKHMFLRQEGKKGNYN